MFYESKDQILTFEIIKGCIESFIFENLRIENNPFVSSVRHNLAGNIINTLMNMGFTRLWDYIKKLSGVEKEKLIDQQIEMISSAITLQLSTSKSQPEKMMLEMLIAK